MHGVTYVSHGMIPPTNPESGEFHDRHVPPSHVVKRHVLLYWAVYQLDVGCLIRRSLALCFLSQLNFHFNITSPIHDSISSSLSIRSCATYYLHYSLRPRTVMTSSSCLHDSKMLPSHPFFLSHITATCLRFAFFHYPIPFLIQPVYSSHAYYSAHNCILSSQVMNIYTDTNTFSTIVHLKLSDLSSSRSTLVVKMFRFGFDHVAQQNYNFTYLFFS